MAFTYYLTIDGIDGGSTAVGHEGAFAVSDYSLDVSALVSAISGAGGTGKATFSPLTVDLPPGPGLTSLLADAASGEVIKSIELQGVAVSVTGTSETVYDLKLSNVVITSLRDTNGGVSLSFDYSLGAISLTTTPLNPDGSLGTPVTTSWDVAQNKAGANIASPVASSTDTGGGGAKDYFLTIDGVDGGSTATGHEGAFVVSDFSFDVSAVVSAISGAGSTGGKATFPPLTVDFTPDSGLTSLFADAASGKVITSIELQGVTPATTSPGKTVYDLKLSNVVITSFQDTSTGLVSVSFDYSQGAVSLTTTPDGSLGTPTTVSWNVAQDKAGATIASPVASSTDTGSGGAKTYYLTIDGVDGGSAATGHEGAFVVGDFSFDVSAVVSAIGGAGGKATFPPLTVEFAPGSGLTSLLADAASGDVIKSIELQGVAVSVTGTSKTVYDLKLSNVVITGLRDTNGGVSLSFDYSLGAISLTTTPLNQDGSLGTPVTVSWDVAQNRAGATIASPVASATETGGGGAKDYFLTIDGVDGGSTATGHEGAFVVSDFSFDVSAVVSAISGAGGSGGKATFPPLTVDFTPDSGLTSLLADAASGKVIKSIELQGVTAATTSPGKTVYDLKLSNVVITSFQDTSTGLVSVSFDYSQGAVSLTTTPEGSLGAPTTVSWDVAQNKAGATIAPPVASSTDTGGGGAKTYFLTIDGVDGGSTATGHEGAFAVSDFSFDVSAVVNAIGGAGGTGGAAFPPLTVDFTPGSGLTSLLADAARGDVIKSIELQGVAVSAVGARETVYDLKLSNVVIADFHESNSGLDSLSLNYSLGAISLTTTPLNPDGSLGTPATVSWDVAQNKAGTNIAPPVASSTDTGGGGAKDYFLTIDGVDSGSTVAGHAGAFVVSDFSFDVGAVISAINGAGGKATFSPLTVDLAADSALTPLLGDAASGKVVTSIELQGVTATGTSAGKTVYDLKLTNVVITKFDNSNSDSSGDSGLDSLSFDYSRGTISLTTTPIEPDGALGTPVTISLNVAANTPPGPSVTDTTTTGEKVAHGTTIAVGTVTPGLPGDMLTLTELTGPDGAVTLANGVVSFAAPADASGNVAFSYQVSDQRGDVSAVVSDTLAVDPGPSVTDITTAGEKVAHNTTVAVGTVTPGLAGDTLTLTELTGPAGAVTLANGVVSFAAPASGNVAFSYQISDQLGDVSAVVSDTLAVDPGPSVTDATTPGEKVAHGTTVAVGTVTPGLPGDTLTLTELTGAAGAVTLANGVVSFAAPASGNVAFSYQISDQLGDVSAVVSDTLAVDPGPKASNAKLYVTAGESVDLTSLLLALDTPGLPGDTLTLTGAGTAGTRGTVSLSNGDLVYTAPRRGTDLFTYTVSDQLHETATAGVDVTLVRRNGHIKLAGTGNIVITTGGNHSVSGGTGGNYVSLGNGNDRLSLGGDDNTVVLGNGNDSVMAGDGSTITLGNGNDRVHAGADSVITAGKGNDRIVAGAGSTISLGKGNDLVYAGANSAVTAGNGNDRIAAAAGSTISLGNGNDLVYAGANSTILFGNGHDIVFAGSNDTITLGKGKDLVAFGVHPSPLTLGNEVVNGFGKDDTLEFSHHLLASFATMMSDARQMGADTVITIDSTDSVTLKGVAVASLTQKNFKFT